MTTCDTRRSRVGQLAGRLREDLDVVLAKDPAARSRWEVLLYPHIHALWLHRVANWWYARGHTFLARACSMFARWVSGIDIHPGATIGRRFFVDHGGAVVIGETVNIGDDVMLYHQVTLGSVGWWRDRTRSPGEARHPTIEDDVIIGTNASVLGPITIGAGSRIGAHCVVLESLPAGSSVGPNLVHFGTHERPTETPDGNATARHLRAQSTRPNPIVLRRASGHE